MYYEQWTAKMRNAARRRVPGSQYFRWFCECCGEPIRILSPDPDTSQYCEVCSGTKKSLMPGGKSGPLDPDSGGYDSIARRCLEDG